LSYRFKRRSCEGILMMMLMMINLTSFILCPFPTAMVYDCCQLTLMIMMANTMMIELMLMTMMMMMLMTMILMMMMNLRSFTLSALSTTKHHN